MFLDGKSDFLKVKHVNTTKVMGEKLDLKFPFSTQPRIVS